MANKECSCRMTLFLKCIWGGGALLELVFTSNQYNSQCSLHWHALICIFDWQATEPPNSYSEKHFSPWIICAVLLLVHLKNSKCARQMRLTSAITNKISFVVWKTLTVQLTLQIYAFRKNHNWVSDKVNWYLKSTA